MNLRKKEGSEEPSGRILVVDDDETALKNLRRVLEKEGHSISTQSNSVRALELLRRQTFDLLISDLHMPNLNGIDLLGDVKRFAPWLEVILITGYATMDGAVEATKRGAFYYLAKPFKPDQLRKLVETALQQRRYREKAAFHYHDRNEPAIIGQSPAIQQVEEVIRQIAPTECNVLITGESGTGKELVAKAIHTCSSRAKGPFAACNCGAFSEDLIANELFGHEKEAFTGATSCRRGLLESANKGTLLLDEISDMPASMQVKLLRVLQERVVVRVGGVRPIPLDVRIVAATARDLKAAVVDGSFRQDLYFRLNVVNLVLPRLSERRQDIPLLAYYFLEKFCETMTKQVHAISDEALDLLKSYDFPGNVRELENILERAVAVSQTSTIEVNDLPPDIVNLELYSYSKTGNPIMSLEEIEKDYIQRVLQYTGGVKSRAAEILGVDRTSLWRKLKKYNLG